MRAYDQGRGTLEEGTCTSATVTGLLAARRLRAMQLESRSQKARQAAADFSVLPRKAQRRDHYFAMGSERIVTGAIYYNTRLISCGTISSRNT